MGIVKRTEGGKQLREVKIRGIINTIIAGKVAETVPVEISLVFVKTVVSASNPFGFVIDQHLIRPLDETPTLPTGTS
jgi:hypothetical protein